jgi:hypothetical protein
MPVSSNARIMQALKKCAGDCKCLQAVSLALQAQEEFDVAPLQENEQMQHSAMSFEQMPIPRGNSTR